MLADTGCVNRNYFAEANGQTTVVPHKPLIAEEQETSDYVDYVIGGPWTTEHWIILGVFLAVTIAAILIVAKRENIRK